MRKKIGIAIAVGIVAIVAICLRINYVNEKMSLDPAMLYTQVELHKIKREKGNEISGTNASDIFSGTGLTYSRLTEKQKEVIRKLSEKIRDFDYETKPGKYNKDETRAEVLVSFRTYNFEELYLVFKEDVRKNAAKAAYMVSEGKISPKNETDVIYKMTIRDLNRNLNTLQKNTEKKGIIRMKKGGPEPAEWNPEPLSADFVNAMTGGFAKAVKNHE